MKTLRLTRKEFLALRNYSCSVPTGVIIGKRWRRARHYHDQDEDDPSKWIIGEYVPAKKAGYAMVEWYHVEILDEVQTLVRDTLYR